MNKLSKSNLQANIKYAVIVILCVSCSGRKAPNNKAEKNEMIPDDIVEMRFDQIKTAEIDTGPVQLRSLNRTLKVSGKITVAPQNYATVCAPLGGFVKSTTLIPGNTIRKGQPLALIENQEFVDIQENYLEAKSRMEFAEAEYRRHTDLFKEDVYSEQNLQQVTADYKSLKAQVTALEQKLQLIGINPSGLNENNISRYVSLVSPIDGYIKTVNVNLGKSITSTDILFEIVNLDNLFLELTIFEKDASRVSAGQKISFYINNETEEHEALITQTGKSIGDDKACKVYARVTRACKNLMPGMYVNAIIQTSGNMVTTLPADAVVNFDDKDYIFIFDRNKEENGNMFTEYRIIEIHKGVSEGGYTEIILPDGFDVRSARVVIKGAYNLLSAKKNAGEMAC
ncbi:MAG: efflux RND transporter periplasmic adaptor subunit [Bacteroidota bacterium]|nr:efflux RND transporter periplasmic adaptor subunit [Bacteroidota bacterium]